MEKIELMGLNEEVLLTKTDEGLPIYMLVNKNVSNYYLTLNVKYGSIHTEFKPKSLKRFIKVPDGIAHFIEHLMFYQPDGTTAHEYFNKLGSTINACTTQDFTYYEVLSSSNFKENLNYLLDYVYTPYFTKENLQAEKDIITEEIKMYEDDIDFNLILKTHECLWHKSKRKNLISGTIESLKKITIDNLNLVYENFYHPENMFLVITGNFNPEEAVAIVNQNLQQKNFFKYDKPIIKEEKEPSKVVTKYYEEKNNILIPKLKVAFKIPKTGLKEYRQDELKFYLTLILKNHFGSTSNLTEKLFKNNIITSPFGYSISIYENYLALIVTSQTFYPEEVIKEIENAMNNLFISEEDLKRFKNCLKSSYILSFDDISETNNLIQDNIMANNRITTDTMEIIEQLNKKDLEKIISKINLTNKTVVVYKPN